MVNDFNMLNIEGILCYEDIPLIDFKILNMNLVYAKDLSGGKLYPWHMWAMGLTYEAFNSFFNDRVVRNHSQDLREFLTALGLSYYNPSEMIKKLNGWDGVGKYWIKFNDIGAKNWKGICTQRYPIY